MAQPSLVDMDVDPVAAAPLGRRDRVERPLGDLDDGVDRVDRFIARLEEGVAGLGQRGLEQGAGVATDVEVQPEPAVVTPREPGLVGRLYDAGGCSVAVGNIG